MITPLFLSVFSCVLCVLCGKKMVMSKIIAHRGASGDAPENTLAAFKKALEIGVDALECDLHVTSDGVPIALHDPYLGRTTNGHGYAHNFTYEELAKLDAGSWFRPDFVNEKIPSLANLLALPRGKTTWMIEIKKNVPCKPIFELLENQKNFLVGSFELNIMEAILERALPAIAIVGSHQNLELLLNKPISHFAIWYKLLSPHLIDRLHGENREVWAYTVDDPDVVKFLLSIGIDGLITNFPKRFKK